jgi:hypothetical protein
MSSVQLCHKMYHISKVDRFLTERLQLWEQAHI